MVLNGARPLLQARAAGKFQVCAYKVTLKTPTGDQVRPRGSTLSTPGLGAAAASVGGGEGRPREVPPWCAMAEPPPYPLLFHLGPPLFVPRR